MFALAAAILFIVAAFNEPGTLTDQPLFWAFLAFAALALHFAYEIALPVYRARRVVAPPQ